MKDTVRPDENRAAGHTNDGTALFDPPDQRGLFLFIIQRYLLHAYFFFII